MTTVSTLETSLGEVEAGGGLLPPPTLIGDPGGDGAVVPLPTAVSLDPGDVEELEEGIQAAAAPTSGVATSSGGFDDGEGALFGVAGEEGRAVTPAWTRELPVVTAAVMEEERSVSLPPALIDDSGVGGAVARLLAFVTLKEMNAIQRPYPQTKYIFADGRISMLPTIIRACLRRHHIHLGLRRYHFCRGFIL